MTSNQQERNLIIRTMSESLKISNHDWLKTEMFRTIYFEIANINRLKDGHNSEKEHGKKERREWLLESMKNKGLISVRNAPNYKGNIRKKVSISDALKKEFESLEIDMIENLFLSRQNQNIELFNELLKGIIKEFNKN